MGTTVARRKVVKLLSIVDRPLSTTEIYDALNGYVGQSRLNNVLHQYPEFRKVGRSRGKNPVDIWRLEM